MNDLTTLPTAWTKFARRLLQAAGDVFAESGADLCRQTAYFVSDGKGDPILWAISPGERQEGKREYRPKKWDDVRSCVADKAQTALSNNKDGCAVASLSILINRENQLVDWKISAMMRIEPSTHASSILRGLLGEH